MCDTVLYTSYPSQTRSGDFKDHQLLLICWWYWLPRPQLPNGCYFRCVPHWAFAGRSEWTSWFTFRFGGSDNSQLQWISEKCWNLNLDLWVKIRQQHTTACNSIHHSTVPGATRGTHQRRPRHSRSNVKAVPSCWICWGTRPWSQCNMGGFQEHHQEHHQYHGGPPW